MNTSRSPQQLLPTRGQITALVVLFAIFCVIIPIEVAGDLLERGEPVDFYHAGMLVGTTLFSGVLAFLLTRWHDRARDALLRSEPH